MLSRKFACRVGGLVVASVVAMACAQSIDEGPLVQDDVGVAKDSNDAGPTPTQDSGPTTTLRDAGLTPPPIDAGSTQDAAPADAGTPVQDSAVDPPDTGATSSALCDTTGLNGIKYGAEFLSAVNPCPCAATECCYQGLACVKK